MRVSCEFTFEAAHHLTRYRGGPEPVHGHSFRLRVSLSGPVREDGMVFDFVELQETVQERVIGVLHHRDLNEVIDNPSAENIAIWVWDRLKDLPLHEITIGESPGATATYHGPEREPSL